MPIQPTFSFEEQYWRQGIAHIAGVDEAGMGAWAGPVVAAAVMFVSGVTIPDTIPLRDSKKLSPHQREHVATWVRENAKAFGVGHASASEIDQLNIRQASHLAIRRAIDELRTSCDLLLIDGNPAQPHPDIPAVNVIDGDALSCSIAAASVLAKVARDHILTELELELPGYGFAQHKGYGTAAHRSALVSLGVSPFHRQSYRPIAEVSKNK